MPYLIYRRIKLEDKITQRELDLQMDVNEVLMKHGVIQGVQLNLGHPGLMYTGDVTESQLLDRLSRSPLKYFIHGPAGSAGVDIGARLDEFDYWEKARQAGYGNWFQYCSDAVNYAVAFADRLDDRGKLGTPYVILHPGFGEGPVDPSAEMNILQILETADSPRIIFETIPPWHAKYLDESKVPEHRYFGLGCVPEQMSFLLREIREAGARVPGIFMDFTHMKVTANQADSVQMITGSRLTYQDLVDGFLQLSPANVCHISGPTDRLVDEHVGFLVSADPGFRQSVNYGLRELERMHGDVIVVLEYSSEPEQIRKFQRDYLHN